MSQISPEELAKRISSADIELLVAMDKMSSEDDKSKRFQVLMTATLATIAGFAIFISSLFPEMSKYVIAILSAIFGVITIALSFYQHKIERKKQLNKIKKNYKSPTAKDKKAAEEYRASLIKRLIKESDDV